MAKKFLLDCTCGERLPVEACQAGEEIACACGARLEVPTLRRLQQLEPVDQPESAATWTRGQGTLFVLGAVCLLVGGAVGTWFYLAIPSEILFPTYRYTQQIAPDSLTRQYQRFPAVIVAMADDLDRRRQDLTPAESVRLWSLYCEVPLVMQQVPAIRREHTRRVASYRNGTLVVLGVTLVLSALLLGGALFAGKRLK